MTMTELEHRWISANDDGRRCAENAPKVALDAASGFSDIGVQLERIDALISILATSPALAGDAETALAGIGDLINAARQRAERHEGEFVELRNRLMGISPIVN